jgi:hypothetical protein
MAQREQPVAKSGRMHYNHAPDSAGSGVVPAARRFSAMNKIFFILPGLLVGTLAARADLTLVQTATGTNATFPATLRLHANQMRLDQPENTNGVITVLINLQTRDSLTLLPQEKKFLKRAGTNILKDLALDLKLFSRTNENLLPAAPAVLTSRVARVNGFDADIYVWHGAHGLTETLWVAKDFPDFAAIRSELAKLDEFNATGPHPNAQPALSQLPGMVVQTETSLGKSVKTMKLLTATTAPLDAAQFELPADYTPWERPQQNVNK